MSTDTFNARWRPVLYFLLGQAGWFACVLSAARGADYLGIVFVAALIALHIKSAKRSMAEAKLLVAVVFIGGAWESVLIALDFLAYPKSRWVLGLAPVWLIALWGLFAAQFNTTYRWLKHRVLAGALLGAIAGPLSFRAGALMGAVRFDRQVPAFVALAIGWSVILPVIIALSRRWDGVE